MREDQNKFQMNMSLLIISIDIKIKLNGRIIFVRIIYKFPFKIVFGQNDWENYLEDLLNLIVYTFKKLKKKKQ